MTLEIKNTSSREEWANVEDFDASTKKRIKNSEILLVPEVGFREESGRLFASETPTFLKYMKKELPKNSVSLCENEGSENFLQLKSSEIFLPIVNVSIDLIKDVGLPTFIALITGYIFWRHPREAKKKDAKVKFEIQIDSTKDKKAISIKYDGPIQGIEKAMNPIDINKLFKQDEKD